MSDNERDDREDRPESAKKRKVESEGELLDVILRRVGLMFADAIMTNSGS